MEGVLILDHLTLVGAAVLVAFLELLDFGMSLTAFVVTTAFFVTGPPLKLDAVEVFFDTFEEVDLGFHPIGRLGFRTAFFRSEVRVCTPFGY